MNAFARCGSAKCRRRATWVWLCLLMVSSAGTIGADDGLAADERGTYVDVLSGKELPLAWQARLGTRSGRPVVHEDKILIGTNNARPREDRFTGDYGVVMCFREDGDFLWQTLHAKLEHRANDLPLMGIQSRPFVDGSRAYYVSNRGELVCVKLEGRDEGDNDGRGRGEGGHASKQPDFVWTLDMVQELGVFKRDALDVGNPVCSPLVHGDLVYCVTGNGSTFGSTLSVRYESLVPFPEAPSFLAVDKTTGAVRWRSNQPGKEILYGQWGSPVVARVGDQSVVVFPGGDGRLYGFDASSGRLLWKLDCNEPGTTEWTRQAAGTRRFFVAAPTVHETTAYVGLNHDLESGSTGPSPIYAIDLGRAGRGRESALVWEFEDADYYGTFGAFAVNEGCLYAVSGTGIVFAIDSRNGQKLWQADLEERPCWFSGPYVHDGLVYVASGTELFVFSAGRPKKLLARYRFDGLIQAAPVVCGNHLLVPTSEHLCAVAIN